LLLAVFFLILICRISKDRGGKGLNDGGGITSAHHGDVTPQNLADAAAAAGAAGGRFSERRPDDKAPTDFQ